jgi:hypothetical protein
MAATQAAHRPSYKPISAVLSFIISLDTLHAPVSFLARMRTRAGVESDTRPRLAVLVGDPEYGQRLELDRSVLPKNDYGIAFQARNAILRPDDDRLPRA